MLLAASVSGYAQQAEGEGSRTLSTVTVRETAEEPEGKEALRASQTTIGKGKQALRDIPQSVTVVTEKLMADRNLYTLTQVLSNTAGVTFQAAEGGEEDVRLRGFSLAGTGDIFLDGMRDPAFYDRDTFNQDRVELLRGSASMLFGRGSTGGAVNQVSKLPNATSANEVNLTLGSHRYRRATGDFNIKTDENAGLRLNAMVNTADDNGAGSSLDKRGIAAGYRAGIGQRDEFYAGFYYLDNRNGINYGIPWIRPRASDPGSANTTLPGLKPTDYYGLDSNRNDGSASIGTLGHTHRFDSGAELKTQLRKGYYTRDLRASAIRFAGTTGTVRNPAAVGLDNLGADTVLTRGTNLKIQQLDTLQAQTDYSTRFYTGSVRHEVLAGVDFSREEKSVDVARSAAQGGVDLVKPPTLLGTPNDGASVDEAARVLRPGNRFVSRNLGAYAQDMVRVLPHWKLLAGLRWDRSRGDYDNFALPADAAGPLTTTSYQQSISALSKRAGVLYQPNSFDSYHFSYGSSFNTSGDTYSYNALSANTPPEQSENYELGAKIDSENRQITTRLALFYAIKKNERNVDPDTAATRLLLSGKRHSAGFEIDVIGRITPRLEIYSSYQWLPVARVDVAAETAATAGNRVGDRPGLSPRHSGTVWATYQLTPQLRFGSGINFRSRQSPADATAPAWEAPGYATIDLLAEYAFTPNWLLRANISNVTDKYYAANLYRGHYVPGAGRLALLTLTGKF